MTAFLIAEAGSCHDGDPKKAIQLVVQAAQAGASAVKFQYWSDANKLARRRNAPELAPMYAKYALPLSWLETLSLAARAHGIKFMATAYLPEDISLVAPFVARFKVASFEARDVEFIRAHAGYGLEVLVSIGLMDVIPDYTSLGVPVRLLHCVSAYPCPLVDINLAVLRSPLISGLSDHTQDEIVGALAVALGAKIVEKHIRLDTTDSKNPDYPHSMSPEKYRRYAALTRDAEKALGDGLKRIMPSERPNLRYQVRP